MDFSLHRRKKTKFFLCKNTQHNEIIFQDLPSTLPRQTIFLAIKQVLINYKNSSLQNISMNTWKKTEINKQKISGKSIMENNDHKYMENKDLLMNKVGTRKKLQRQLARILNWMKMRTEHMKFTTDQYFRRN